MYEAWTVEWNMPVIVRDPFRRDANSSWGTAPGGLDWINTGGSATDYSVDRRTGRMLLGTVNTSRIARLPISVAEVDFTATIYNHNAVIPAGGGFEYGARIRYVDDSNFVDMRVFPSTSNSISISIRQMVGGVETTPGFPSAPGLTATDTLKIRVQAHGSALRARIWALEDDQPTTWHMEMATTWLTAGALELRAIRAAGGTNTETIIIGWDDVEVLTPERWVDVTRYVDVGAGTFQITDGDTPEASADTGGFGLPLLNADQRFTPGNIYSPYAPNIVPGSEIRVRETIGDIVFPRGYGFVQYPEITAWTESNGDSPRDQQVTIPVVDRAAWIAQGRNLISTLGEHIIANGGPALVAYWPLSETEGPDVNPAVGGPWTLTQTTRNLGGGNASSDDPPAIIYGSTTVAPADDLAAVEFVPSYAADPFTEYDSSYLLVGDRPTPVTLDENQVLTLVAWIRTTQEIPASSANIPIMLKNSANGDIAAQIHSSGGGTYDGFAANDSNWVGTATGPPVPVDQPIPVAVRVGFDPDTIECWVRGEVYTDTLIVVSPTAAEYDRIQLGLTFPGTIAHLQLYIGDPDDWTNDDFVAQYQMGLHGLERQTTGERIRTVLEYAGVDPAELGRIDDGVSRMQVARMAGRNPMDLVAEAVETEQGEFWVAGDNRPVFADRVRLYNV